MEIKRTTEIFVETKRRFEVYLPNADAASKPIFCPACNSPVVAAEAAAAFFGIKCRLVYQFVEASQIHFVETEASATHVCPSSLAALLETNSKKMSAASEGDRQNEREI